jgi:hypothetical protein
MPKGFQNEGKIDAKTHQKTIPKHVPKQMGEITKNKFF